MSDSDITKRVETGCDTLNDLVKRLCEQFNGMRSELATFVDICKNFGESSPRFAQTLRSLTHGDYGDILHKYRSEYKNNFKVNIKGAVNDVEEIGGFASMLSIIMNMKKPETRMLACIDVNDKIAESISSWQSKIEKMKTITKADGSSDTEVNVAEKRIIQFGAIIEILKKRGCQISEIFHDSSRQLDKFQKDCKMKFKYIYHNDKV